MTENNKKMMNVNEEKKQIAEAIMNLNILQLQNRYKRSEKDTIAENEKKASAIIAFNESRRLAAIEFAKTNVEQASKEREREIVYFCNIHKVEQNGESRNDRFSWNCGRPTHLKYRKYTYSTYEVFVPSFFSSSSSFSFSSASAAASTESSSSSQMPLRPSFSPFSKQSTKETKS